MSSGQGQETESEPPETTPSPSSTSNSTSSLSSSSISTYNWCAGLGGIGFLETAYLTYIKLTNSDAFCPIGGGNCDDVLNSDYAAIFGICFFVQFNAYSICVLFQLCSVF